MFPIHITIAKKYIAFPTAYILPSSHAAGGLEPLLHFVEFNTRRGFLSLQTRRRRPARQAIQQNKRRANYGARFGVGAKIAFAAVA